MKKLAVLLSSLALTGLFATDSITTPESTGYSISFLESYYVKLGFGESFFSKPTIHCSNQTQSGSVRAGDVRMGHGTPFMMAFGYHFNDHFRSDLSFDYRSSVAYHLKDDGGNAANGKIRMMNLMLNGYYDFDKLGPVTPYLGLGLGVHCNYTQSAYWHAITTTDVTEKGKHARGASWSVAAGMQYPIFDRLNLDVSYRVSNIGRFATMGHFSDGTSGDPIHSNNFYAHDILLCLVYNY